MYISFKNEELGLGLQLDTSTREDMYFQYVINLRTDDLLLITTKHFILQFTFCYFIKETESSMFSGFHSNVNNFLILVDF